jgi:hypothetical protein
MNAPYRFVRKKTVGIGKTAFLYKQLPEEELLFRSTHVMPIGKAQNFDTGRAFSVNRGQT